MSHFMIHENFNVSCPTSIFREKSGGSIINDTKWRKISSDSWILIETEILTSQ
jgi:hypothetical protein